MSQTIDRTLRDARQALKAGQARQARRLLLEAHERFPMNSRILSDLRALETKVSGLPATPFGPAHVKRIMALRAAKRMAEAIEEMVSYAFLNLESPLARGVLGGLYLEAGHPEAALPHLKAALRADPSHVEARVQLAVTLTRLNRHPEAMEHLETVLQAMPDHILALKVKVDVCQRTIGPAAAEEPLRRLARLMPDDEQIRIALAGAVAVKQDGGEAEKILQDYLDTNSTDFRAMVNLGNMRLNQGRMSEAEALFRKAVAVEPKAAFGYFNLGRTVTFQPGDPALPGLMALADDRTIPVDEQVAAQFAASKALEDLGDVDASFARLAEGNRLRRSQSSYHIRQDEALLRDIAGRFAAHQPPLDAAGLTVHPRRPVFVVGMMRSGTTLAEQILSSHSQVHGAGELETMNRLMLEEMARQPGPLDQAALKRVREAYLTDIASLPGQQPVVIDKMPANFRAIGLIAKAIPEARFIHMRRDPVAVCWSIYKTLFTLHTIGYAWDLTEVGQYYRLYEGFMQAIEAQYPGMVLHVDYKELTETPEPVIRRMLDYCGLPFEAACLSPEKNDRAVRTASVRQVRSGIYTGSTSKWRGFEKHMGPLLEALKQPATSF